jgi:hypothetical protein
MAIQTTTSDRVASALNRFDDADDLCRDLSDDGALAMAQVQATIGVGHAVLALARHFNSDSDDLTFPVGYKLP